MTVIYDALELNKIFEGQINYRHKIVISIKNYNLININFLKEDKTDIFIFFRIYDLYNYFNPLLISDREKLECSNLSLKSFPFFDSQRIKELYLSENKFCVIQDLALNFPNLEVLSLSKNLFEEIPHFSFKHLKKFFIDSCKLKKISNIKYDIDYFSLIGNNIEKITLKDFKCDKMILYLNPIKQFSKTNCLIKEILQ